MSESQSILDAIFNEPSHHQITIEFTDDKFDSSNKSFTHWLSILRKVIFLHKCKTVIDADKHNKANLSAFFHNNITTFDELKKLHDDSDSDSSPNSDPILTQPQLKIANELITLRNKVEPNVETYKAFHTDNKQLIHQFIKGFNKCIDTFIKLREQDMAKNISTELINTIKDNGEKTINVPFFTKHHMPKKSTIHFHGDFHGNIDSMLHVITTLQQQKIMDGFKIVNKSHYLVFLGDYVDRGLHGFETLYTMMLLAINNPNNFIAVRGNHESIQLNKNYGFTAELNVKFKNSTSKKLLIKINHMYNLLPLASFLYFKQPDSVHNRITMCCHGFIDPRIRLKPFITNNDPTIKYFVTQNYEYITQVYDIIKNNYTAKDAIKYREDIINLIKDDNTNKVDCYNHYMWGDVKWTNNGVGDQPFKSYYGRVSYSKKFGTEYLKELGDNNNTLCTVIRAHQHGELELNKKICAGKGIAKMWENNHSNDFLGTKNNINVFTCGQSPCGPYSANPYAKYFKDDHLISISFN